MSLLVAMSEYLFISEKYIGSYKWNLFIIQRSRFIGSYERVVVYQEMI